MYTPGRVNLTNELAKLSLQVGRPGGVGSAAGPQDRHTAGGEEGEGGHGAGGAGREGGQGGRGGRRRQQQWRRRQQMVEKTFYGP
jgi:hypothetical protein